MLVVVYVINVLNTIIVSRLLPLFLISAQVVGSSVYVFESDPSPSQKLQWEKPDDMNDEYEVLEGGYNP